MRNSLRSRGQYAFLGLLALFLVSAHSANVDASPEQYSPFSNPLLDRNYERPDGLIKALVKRAGCPVSYNGCLSLGNAGLCCPDSNTCALDQAGNIACCPTGAACTGTIATTGLTAATGVTTTTTGGTTSGGGIVLGTTTTSSAGSVLSTGTATTTAAAGVTTVPNAAYPFVYIPTTFSDASVCSSYYTGCQTQYASCTAVLGGSDGNVVTISGVTGIVTVGGATATLAASAASSVCSTLSQSACYGLTLQQCSQYGGGSFIAGQTGAAAPRFTGCPGGMYAMGAGVALGMAGALG